MKKFENPTIEIEKFEMLDVITASNDDGCGNFNCPNDLGCATDW